METNAETDIAWEQEVPMPKFRFETIAFDQTTTVEDVLASGDLASSKAAELSNAALKAAAPTGGDPSGSVTKVYDHAG